MNALALDVDQTLRSVDKATATRLERLVRNALDLVISTLSGCTQTTRTRDLAAAP